MVQTIFWYLRSRGGSSFVIFLPFSYLAFSQRSIRYFYRTKCSGPKRQSYRKEVCISFYPREEYPKQYEFLKMWAPLKYLGLFGGLQPA